MFQVLALALTTGIVLVLDGIWLTTMKPFYKKLVEGIQHSPMMIKIVPAILSYVCVVVSIVFFAFPMTQSASFYMPMPLAALVYGGGLGLVVYGVWNFTNMAVFKAYNWIVGLFDLCWGVLLYTVVVYILVLFRKWKNSDK